MDAGDHPRHRKRQRGGDRSHGGAYLKDLLRSWMRHTRVRERVDPTARFGKWNDIVGEKIAARTRIVDVSGGELIVEVDSAPLLNELSTYYRYEILASLREHAEFEGIQKIRFRAGSF